jgi:hypothetical protein
VKDAAITKAEVEVLGIGAVQQPQSHPSRRHLGNRSDRSVDDHRVAANPVDDTELVGFVVERSVGPEGPILDDDGNVVHAVVMRQTQVITVVYDDEPRQNQVGLSCRVVVGMGMVPERRSGLVDPEGPLPGGTGLDLRLRSAICRARDRQAVPMDRRGCVECVLHDHLHSISATEAEDGSKDGRRVAECPRGLSLVEFVEAGRRLEIYNVSLPSRIDQLGNRQGTAGARSFASGEPRIQHRRRRDDARTQH